MNLPLAKFQNPLEECLAHALAHATPKKHRHSSLDPKFSDLRVREEFAFPSDRWVRVRVFALMHQETNSLIGSYAEYRHVRFPDAKTWIHEEGIALVEGTVWVSGPQWVDWRDTPYEALQRALIEQEAILDLHLPEMGVSALSARVIIMTNWGGLYRIELCEPTQFISPDHLRAITLPHRLNVMEALGVDSKLAAKAEVGL